MEQINLKIRSQVFLVNKGVLCQYSDYFKAMFSGKYVEDQQEEVSIDILEPSAVSIILQYMNSGFIDLSTYSLTTIGEILIAANFLQIIELLKQIELSLYKQISVENWMVTMETAECCLYTKLVQFCITFGLYAFKSMKPEYVPTLHKLAWYLSHPYLDTQNEFEVFNFGLQWFLTHDTGADTLLIILGCLDFKRITHQEICEIKKNLIEFVGTLASKVVDCFHELSTNGVEISETVLNIQKCDLSAKFSYRVWSEAINIVKHSKCRLLYYTPVIPLHSITNNPQYIYTFKNDKGFETWLDVEENKWGWNIISWGRTKLVIVGCERANSTGTCVRDVKVYDTLWKQWIPHGVDLPVRSLAGVTIVADSLYIIGGMGDCVCHASLKTALVYNLKDKVYKNIAELPEGLLHPAICTHKDVVYVAGKRNIYCYDATSNNWKMVITTEIRMRSIVSHKDHIYCIERQHRDLFRFKPDVDQTVEIITNLHYPPAKILNIGETLLIITSHDCAAGNILSVEKFDDKGKKETDIIYRKINDNPKLNMVSGSCTLAMILPPTCNELSEYHKPYLKRYSHLAYIS